jgi:hypothetical protein
VKQETRRTRHFCLDGSAAGTVHQVPLTRRDTEEHYTKSRDELAFHCFAHPCSHLLVPLT